MAERIFMRQVPKDVPCSECNYLHICVFSDCSQECETCQIRFGPRLSSLGLSFFKIIYFFYCVLGSCTLYTLYKTIFILLYSIKNYLQSAALFFIFGVPKGTRTSIARLGGGCSILLSYKHISS